jgi:predicted ATPase
VKRPLTLRELRTVIESIRLKRFKNFQDATLKLGPLTILIGANAAGKSNLRDAFLFLHGIGRGYSLAEIFGENYIGGERVWSGTQGGVREVAYLGSDSFELILALRLPPENRELPPVEYQIEVSVAGPAAKAPRVVQESLRYPLRFGINIHVKGQSGFRTNGQEASRNGDLSVSLSQPRGTKAKNPKTYPANEPILTQVSQDDEKSSREARALSRFVLHELRGFRFLDLSPAQMRIPSLRGQTTLGDRGENLSPVLAAACADASRKEILLEWVRKLTPMDVDDLRFDEDAAGRILLRLVEKDGSSISALSASDGTLRFLAILAALFGPEPASLYFIEEIENGIHPTRLGLLVDLIEHQTKRRGIQIVATSHSPQLLQVLSEESLKNCSLVYRLSDHPDAKIKPILEIPNARRVIEEQPVWVLHASSWFEDVMNLTEDVGPQSMNGNQPAP